METRRDTPVFLMSLPIEVQTIVAKQLSDRRDLRALTLVNRHFATISQPLLFKEVDVGWNPKEPSPLTLVTRTLLDRPDLAASVKSLRLDGYEFPEREPEVISTISVTGLNMIKAAGIINGTGADFADLWAQGVSDGEVDALVALLVLTVPNIRDIYLGTDFCIEVIFLTLMLDRREQSKPNVNLPALKHLTKVTMENHYADLFQEGINFNDGVLNFFNLPQLENLSIAISPIAAQPWRPDERFQIMANLTFLHLLRASEEQLGAILSLTPRVVHLKWSGYWCPKEEYPEVLRTTIDLDKLRTALSKRRRSLQYLTLEVVDDTTTVVDFIWPMKLTGTPLWLTDFTNLVRLIIPWVLLMGWCPQDSRPLIDKLPTNLVSLTLTDDLCYQKYWRWTKEEVQDLVRDFVVEHLNAPTTYLRKISLAGAIFDDQWTPKERKFAQTVCRKAGIKFKIHPTTPWEDEKDAAVKERKRRYG
ncbi:uncharacterized protein FTOL_05981 [Fusarium torulosum]|uniref:F-box domain-containing protein n=1 Tax=Fusarium torulosum TaxID=33205 RepID=A0AAE8M8N7_9HYPO|nr:uncharacterized protein FTOL_05981 [Fusarium torulosum]